MSGYVNKTSLQFILVFMIIIAVSLGIFEVLHRLEERRSTPAEDELLAEPRSLDVVETKE